MQTATHAYCHKSILLPLHIKLMLSTLLNCNGYVYSNIFAERFIVKIPSASTHILVDDHKADAVINELLCADYIYAIELIYIYILNLIKLWRYTKPNRFPSPICKPPNRPIQSKPGRERVNFLWLRISHKFTDHGIEHIYIHINSHHPPHNEYNISYCADFFLAPLFCETISENTCSFLVITRIAPRASGKQERAIRRQWTKDETYVHI